jgi:hypothetical protein
LAILMLAALLAIALVARKRNAGGLTRYSYRAQA